MTDRAPAGHSKCAQLLHDLASDKHTEIVVSTAPPIIRTPYTTDPYTCPHGVTFWIEPTSEQQAKWAKEGTP